LVEEIIKLIREAGTEVLKVYNSDDYQVETKSDNSPLTKADLLSNEILMEGLVKIVSLPVLSEEVLVDYNLRKDWNKFWIIDPLDGTKDFIAKNDEFTINVALIEDNVPILGFIYAPALGDLYWGKKNGGSYKNGQKIFNNSKRNELIGTHSRFHSNPETAAFFTNNNISIIKEFGSALKFCKLAEGVVDIYPRYTGSVEWDIAAGDIILQEAGCKMLDLLSKKEFRYNRKDLLNSYFIAARYGLLSNEGITY
jgi:3'(2'), 5'-bisphosphate nucleotidase